MTTEPMTSERALAMMDELIGIPVIECLDDEEFVAAAKEARAFFAAMVERERAQVKVLHEALRAIGDHDAPTDCYATGPLTGDTFRDLVECPACSFISMFDALKLQEPRP